MACQNKRRSESPSIMDTLIDVVCMNCQNLINLNDIEFHSRICTTIAQTVRDIEEE